VASVLRSIEVYPEFIDLVFSFSYSLIFKYKFTNPVRFVVYISSAGSLPNTHAYACGGCDLLTRGLWPTTHLIHTHSGLRPPGRRPVNHHPHKHRHRHPMCRMPGSLPECYTHTQTHREKFGFWVYSMAVAWKRFGRRVVQATMDLV